jgi:hypothetical protein
MVGIFKTTLRQLTQRGATFGLIEAAKVGKKDYENSGTVVVDLCSVFQE